MFAALTQEGVVSRAVQRGQIALQTWNPRDFATDRYRTVDDRPYGGGPGMVMKIEPLRAAIIAAKSVATEGFQTDVRRVIYLSPQGARLTQAKATAWAREPGLILVAGRYEGVDERIIGSLIDAECSIGDYVLSGGELAAMVVIDAVARMIPGVLGHDESAQQDSFMAGLLDYPHYTRPELAAEGCVPSVLLSGDHAAIRRWRLKQALGRTWLRRPDLLTGRGLTGEQQLLLEEFLSEQVRASTDE